MSLKLKMNSDDPAKGAPKKRMSKALLYTLETLGVLLVLVFLGFMGVLIRIHTKPLDVSFAKDYILAQVEDGASGVRYDMDSLTLYWPELNGDFYLSASKLRAIGADKADLISVDQVAVGLVKAPLFFGRVRPQVLVVQSPRFSVTRDAEGGIDIGFGTMHTDLDADILNPDQNVAEKILDVFYAEGRGQAFSQLRSLEVWDATVAVQDAVNDAAFELKRMDFIVSRKPYGLVASSKVSLPGVVATDPVVGVSADIAIPRNGKMVRADIRVSDGYVRFLEKLMGDEHSELLRKQSGLIQARADVQLDGHFMPKFVDVNMISERGIIVLPELYPSGVAYEDLDLHARYDYGSKAVFVEDSGVSLRGVPVAVGADFVWNDGELTGPMRVDIARLSHGQLKNLWPESLVEGNSYKWAVTKITGADFKDVFAQFYLRADADDGSANAENLMTGFRFTGAQINYRSPLTPVTQAVGKAVFNLDQERMNVDVSSAKLMDMKISKADVILTEILKEKQGKVDIEIDLDGPLASALRFVKDEPIGADIDVDFSKVRGSTALDIGVRLPLLKDIKLSDVWIDIKGQARDAVLPKFVRGLDIAGDVFDVRVAKNLLTVKGAGQLNSRPVDAVFEQYLISKGKPFRSRITAKIDADPSLRAHFGLDLDDFLSGTVPIDLSYKETSATRRVIDVTGNLAPARVFVEAFGYEKPVGVGGDLRVQAIVEKDEIKEVKGLSVNTPGFVVRDGGLGFIKEELSNGVFPYFEIGESKGRVEFSIAPDGAQNISMDMAFLDLRPFLDDEDDKEQVYDDPPRIISIKTAEMRASDYPIMTDGKFYIDINRAGQFNQMEMDGIAGTGAIYLRYKLDESGKRAFRLEADDAGKTLEAFDLYDKIRGGKLVIYGEPIRGVFDRNLVGKAEITDFRVVKAPGLAKLMSAMSLPGMLNLLNNDGLVFSKLAADFNWLYRPQGSLLVLKDGRTSGNSVGLTFDGTFDHAAHTVDLSGTIVPLSGINNLVSSIPIVGQILSGGTGSVFAATYTMKGSGDDPKVVVNPLAALTPGILRRIFFEQK